MKYRVHLIVGGSVGDTQFVEADGFDQAEDLAARRSSVAPESIERYLVEPIPACVDCGKELPQPDPRNAKHPDGSPVYPDPLDAFRRIRCVACGAAKFMGGRR